MTELLIDGVAVELPAAFSISIKRENPFFTKSGEYTYDIELPLESGVNASLYSFLHRINSAAEIKPNRRAILRADNRVYLDGTEVITGWTDKHVKIQLVSGNSELNFLADEKTLISDVKMPVTNPLVDGQGIDRKYIEKFYPDIEFCFPMVARPDDTRVNDWKYTKDPSTGRKNWFAQSDAEYGMIPMPYLCAYLKHLIEGLGFHVRTNALENSFAKYLILVHSQKTYDWGKMFPGMTVREFLETIENTFNVSFKSDFRKKSVDILINRAYFFEVPNAFVQNVVDEYDCDTENDEQDKISCNSKSFVLGYNFPSTKYYNEAALSEFVKSVALVVDDSFTGNLYSYFNKGDKSTEKIYQVGGDVEKGRFDSMVWSSDHHTTGHPKYHYVDFFREHTEGHGDTVVKMKMIPAEIKELDGFPFVVAGDSVPKGKDELKLDDILAMKKEDEGNAGTLRMAFYKGLVKGGYPKDSRIETPVAFTDYSFPVNGTPKDVKVEPSLSLKPSCMAQEFFTGGYDIDIRHPVKISSYDVNLYDTSSVFLIRNKRFLCRDIEYQIGAEGRAGAWVGTFYPVNLPDTEVYKRWILSDGHWRDSGVWLDDGRWLDDKPINHDNNTNTDTL